MTRFEQAEQIIDRIRNVLTGAIPDNREATLVNRLLTDLEAVIGVAEQEYLVLAEQVEVEGDE